MDDLLVVTTACKHFEVVMRILRAYVFANGRIGDLTFRMIEVPDEFCGPAMLALSARRRAFAYLMGCGESNAAKAAREAGYSDSSGADRVTAHHLMLHAGVQAAIKEVSSKALQHLAPTAIGAAKKILEDPKHPAHARIVETILDRTGFSAKTEHKVTVEHTADMAQLEEYARRLAVEQGLREDALLPSPKVIEGEVVARGTDPD